METESMTKNEQVEIVEEVVNASLREETFQRFKQKPHAVILGAGASVAAIPEGDKNGEQLSCMDGFINQLGLQEIMEETGCKSNNLEDVYDNLTPSQKQKLEDAIHDYLTGLALPDAPTVYDLLLLSLREKDVVATFNWDPLLYQAWKRVQKLTTSLPRILCLHGNVAVYLCEKDCKFQYCLDGKRPRCSQCGQLLTPSRLLYPVRHKNYNQDLFIRDQWNTLQEYLQNAYILTIFGYSAPRTDVEAKQLLLDAWGGGETRRLEQIEIIDIKDEAELAENWDAFICSHHYQVCPSFYQSSLSLSPRRTTEDLFAESMEAQFLDKNPQWHEGMSWDDVAKVVTPILKQ